MRAEDQNKPDDDIVVFPNRDEDGTGVILEKSVEKNIDVILEIRIERIVQNVEPYEGEITQGQKTHTEKSHTPDGKLSRKEISEMKDDKRKCVDIGKRHEIVAHSEKESIAKVREIFPQK